MSRVVFYSEPNDRVRLAEDLAPDDLDVSVIDPELPWDERKELLADTEVLILGGLAMPYEELIQLPKLKMLQLMSAGYDQIDVPAVREQGIFVSNNSPQIARSVAEHALGLMLTVQHKFVPGLEGVRDGSWRNPVRSGVYEIGGKTIGIIGLGNIGRLVATMVRGFGPAEVIYHDTANIPAEVEAELGVRRVGFEELLSTSDIVTVHVPLFSETLGMMNSDAFTLMKESAIFINTCRGPVQNEADLIDALNDGQIRAAGLDVFEVEPTPVDNPLLSMDNVVVTPHLAGSSEERVERALVFSYQNARRVMSGTEPEGQFEVLT
jgi:glyoxylate reductase/D-3-phosphoglycerate dehydrogenase|tara:strand:- start:296 stop:1261 length:966 start_codon:yes stop_codon:yes gene_type:complete